MNTLNLIEQKNKFRNCIINFKKYFDNLDKSNRHYIINDMNAWINLKIIINQVVQMLIIFIIIYLIIQI
jgi:hypothetical protein